MAVGRYVVIEKGEEYDEDIACLGLYDTKLEALGRILQKATDFDNVNRVYQTFFYKPVKLGYNAGELYDVALTPVVVDPNAESTTPTHILYYILDVNAKPHNNDGDTGEWDMEWNE